MPGRCPDPNDCTVNNGGGVYTEELGHAGIGSLEMMVLRFRSVIEGGAPIVYWDGRYRDVTTADHYKTITGYVYHALYTPLNGTSGSYSVLDISENLTAPTFKLTNGTTTLTVGPNASDLTRLHLVLYAPLPSGDMLYTLSFGARHLSDPVVTLTEHHTLEGYEMFGNEGPGPNPATQQEYCLRAGLVDLDYAVFQQGISVDPLTAVTAFGQAKTVTLSCRNGAIATARGWGYIYRGNEQNDTLFEAVMHMKRASYCGDLTFFTQSPTAILINDAEGIRQSSYVTPMTVEAKWGRPSPGAPVRALCVNTRNLRRPLVTYPQDGGSEFKGHCYNEDTSLAFDIPSCDGVTGMVADAKAP